MITIQELLYNRGLAKNSKTKLVRHKDNNHDLYNLYLTNKESFLLYQSQQAKDIFSGVDYIVSFIGEDGTLARFIGVYKIIGSQKLLKEEKSVDGNYHNFKYEIEEIQGFEDLKERVIINWGKGAIQWAQGININKEVVEIQPGLHYTRFKDYFDFVINFKQLEEIVRNQYPDWKRMLSATKGIYLISDTLTGKLYVGSAYGDLGIWGRWSNYVSTGGHANNVKLIELVNSDSNYAQNFRFSILMLLPKTITSDQAIEKEKLFKQKLGTNSFGLNLN